MSDQWGSVSRAVKAVNRRALSESSCLDAIFHHQKTGINFPVDMNSIRGEDCGSSVRFAT